MYTHIFVSAPQNVDFAHYFLLYNLYIADTTISRVCLLRTIQTCEIVLLAMDTFYNGTYSAKSTFCGVETKNIFTHIRSSAPNMFVTRKWQK